MINENKHINNYLDELFSYVDGIINESRELREYISNLGREANILLCSV